MERAETESHSIIRLEGECTLTSAGELKRLLLEAFASGKDLRLDLELADEIDVTIMQLIWAAERDAARSGIKMLSSASEAAATGMRKAGFGRFPGAAIQE